MKKLLLSTIIAFTLLLTSYNSLFATHLAGMELYYEYLGTNDDYLVTLRLTRACSGIQAKTSYTLEVSSSCSNFTTDLMNNLGLPANGNIPAGSGIDITNTCIGQVSTCDGGTTYGYEVYFYTDTISLSQCTDWELTVGSNNRNGNITTGASNQPLYITATLDNLTEGHLSSTYFANPPTFSICLGQQLCYNLLALNIDSAFAFTDSIIYELADPIQDNQGTPTTWVSGTSSQDPFLGGSGISIDPLSGDFCIMPTQNQITIMAIRAKKYRNGHLVSSTVSDFQINIINCPTNTPPEISDFNGNFNGGANQTTINEGISFSNTFNFYDLDSTIMNVSVTQGTPGYPNDLDINITGNGTTSPSLTAEWNNPTVGTHCFAVNVTDQAPCSQGQSYFATTATTFCLNVVEDSSSTLSNLPLNAGSSISYYPNPTSSTLFISSNSSEQGLVEIKLLNALGETVRTFGSKQWNNSPLELSMQGLSSGQYFLQLNENGKTSHHNVTVQ